MPSEQGYWKWVTEKAGEICQLYGYQRIDTPVLRTRVYFCTALAMKRILCRSRCTHWIAVEIESV